MENGVVNLAHGLQSRGIETHVACLTVRGAFAERLPAPERAIALGKTGGFSLSAAWRLARLLNQVRPQLLHTHNLGPLIYGTLATLGGTRCPILHGEHSQMTPEERHPRRLRQRRWLYRACRHIHTVAHGIHAELLAEGFPPGPLSVIPNGVDTTRFRPGDKAAARQHLALPLEGRFIGLVGRFGPFKRHALLLEAFERIAERLPDTRLVFAGAGGPEESRVRALAAASPLSARIHFTGLQRRPEIVYQALDLLTIPSVNEGLSNVALEAMASALPVLANLGCGHEHILCSGREGRITDLNSAPRLADEILDLLTDRERALQWATQARQRVETEFSLERMLNAYEHRYRSLARP